jgi:predicted MPP superfamily phosphohydrolase
VSDIHAGSFSDAEPLKLAVEKINALKPDIFVFTGDLVNNKASEFTPYIDVFKDIKAKYGQFSILGNHDYGDYIQWPSPQDKEENFSMIKQYHRDTNWDIGSYRRRKLGSENAFHQTGRPEKGLPWYRKYSYQNITLSRP